MQSARFITAKKSKMLIQKLSSFVGEPQADILNQQLYVDHRLKARNETIYFTVDLIHQAIRLKKRVTFQYYYYTPNKKKELKHTEIQPFRSEVWRGYVFCFACKQ